MKPITESRSFDFLQVAPLAKKFKASQPVLDRKITQIALRILSRLAFIGGVILAAVSLVVGPISYGSIAGVIGSFALSAFFQGVYKTRCRHFDDAKELEAFRQEALGILRTSQSYECQELDKYKELRDVFKKPLDCIFDTFGASAVFRYQLLTPEQFKEAFLLQVKYMKVQEAIAFYEQVVKTCSKEKLPAGYPPYEIPVPSMWKKSLQEEFKSHTPFSFFEEIKIDLLHKNGLITEQQYSRLNALKEEVEKARETYFSYSQVSEGKKKAYLRFKTSLQKVFTGHKAHSMIHTEQKFFFKKTRVLELKCHQMRQEAKIKFDEQQEAAKTWCEGDLNKLAGEPLRLYNEFKKEYADSSMKIDTFFKRELGKLNENLIRNISPAIKDLESFKTSLEKEYQDTYDEAAAKLFPNAKAIKSLQAVKQKEFDIAIRDISNRLDEVIQEL